LIQLKKEKPVNNLISLQSQNESLQQATETLYVAYQQSPGIEKNSLANTETSEAQNEEWIRDYFGNDYSIAIPILQLFIEEMLPEIEQLATVLNKHGVQELRKKVHKINPSFKMVGQASLSSALTDLENDCITFEEIDDLHFKIRKIQTQTEKLKPLIIKQYNSLSKLVQ
jgi:HPt (histidine-containing phosphotransfer) domain-containing protein